MRGMGDLLSRPGHPLALGVGRGRERGERVLGRGFNTRSNKRAPDWQLVEDLGQRRRLGLCDGRLSGRNRLERRGLDEQL